MVNLSPNKEAVLKEAYRVLQVIYIATSHFYRMPYHLFPQNGGEMFFSDVYSNKAVPETLKQNRVLWGKSVGIPLGRSNI